MSIIKELHGLLKTASDQMKLAQDVIFQLADENARLTHQVAARDVAIKLAAAGMVGTGELPEKVAEFVEKTAEDLELEEKIASYHGGSGHRLHESKETAEGVGALAFL